MHGETVKKQHTNVSPDRHNVMFHIQYLLFIPSASYRRTKMQVKSLKLIYCVHFLNFLIRKMSSLCLQILQLLISKLVSIDTQKYDIPSLIAGFKRPQFLHYTVQNILTCTCKYKFVLQFTVKPIQQQLFRFDHITSRS